MDPLEFWERCLDIIDRNKIKLFPKYSIPFNLLLVLLETRPCCLIDGDKQKEAVKIIVKNFSGLFKIKNIKHSNLRKNSSGYDFVWSTREPKSPTERDLKSQNSWVKYIGKLLDYSCPGDVMGITPWSKSWAINFSLKTDGEEEYSFFGEVCINKSHFKSRLRDFQGAATIISSSERKYKVVKNVRLKFLPPNRWINDSNWMNISTKEKFYQIGIELDGEILDKLWELFLYSFRSKWRETEEKEMDISREDVKRIREIFPNIYLFEKTGSGYKVSSKLM